MDKQDYQKRRNFILKNLNIVDDVINKVFLYDNTKYDYSDLHQEGYKALVIAANTYKGRGMIKFCEYANDIIYHYISLYRLKNMSYLTFDITDRMIQILPDYIHFRNILDESELINILKINSDELEILNRIHSPVEDLNDRIQKYYNDSQQSENFDTDSYMTDFDQLLINTDIHTIIKNELEKSNRHVKNVYITYLLGCISGNEVSEEYLAKKFKISKEYVHRIITHTNEKLKRQISELL